MITGRGAARTGGRADDIAMQKVRWSRTRRLMLGLMLGSLLGLGVLLGLGSVLLIAVFFDVYNKNKS